MQKNTLKIDEKNAREFCAKKSSEFSETPIYVRRKGIVVRDYCRKAGERES